MSNDDKIIAGPLRRWREVTTMGCMACREGGMLPHDWADKDDLAVCRRHGEDYMVGFLQVKSEVQDPPPETDTVTSDYDTELMYVDADNDNRQYVTPDSDPRPRRFVSVSPVEKHTPTGASTEWTAEILERVATEREAQVAHHQSGKFTLRALESGAARPNDLRVLMEEIGEYAAACNDGLDSVRTLRHAQDEMIQSAAVAVAIAEGFELVLQQIARAAPQPQS